MKNDAGARSDPAPASSSARHDPLVDTVGEQVGSLGGLANEHPKSVASQTSDRRPPRVLRIRMSRLRLRHVTGMVMVSLVFLVSLGVYIIAVRNALSLDYAPLPIIDLWD